LNSLTKVTKDTRSYDSFMSSTLNIPILTVEEEQKLAIRYYEENDLYAAEQLAIHSLRYVAKLAHELSPKNKFKDSFQEGCIGLLKAIKAFNPYIGVRLITFATHHIKSAILEYNEKTLGDVKLLTQKAHFKIYYNIGKFTSPNGDIDIDGLCEELNVTPEDVDDYLMRMNSEVYLEYETDDGETSLNQEVIEYSSTEDNNIELFYNEQMGDAIKMALTQLNDREQHIIDNFYFSENPITLKEMGEIYDVSLQRIEQIKRDALKKLEKIITSEFGNIHEDN